MRQIGVFCLTHSERAEREPDLDQSLHLLAGHTAHLASNNALNIVLRVDSFDPFPASQDPTYLLMVSLGQSVISFLRVLAKLGQGFRKAGHLSRKRWVRHAPSVVFAPVVPATCSLLAVCALFFVRWGRLPGCKALGSAKMGFVKNVRHV